MGLALYKWLAPAPLIGPNNQEELQKSAKELQAALQIQGEKEENKKESARTTQDKFLSSVRVTNIQRVGIKGEKVEGPREEGLNIKQWAALFQCIYTNGSLFLSSIPNISTISTDSKFLMSLYKYPLGIYLHPVNISAIIKLMNIFYTNLFTSNRASELPPTKYELEAFNYLILIFKQHLNVLDLLNLSVKDMKWDRRELKRLYKSVIYPFLQGKAYLRYPSEGKFMLELKGEFLELLFYGLKFLFEDEAMIFTAARDYLKKLNTSSFDPDMTLVFLKALNLDNNLELLTKAFISKSNTDIVEILDYIMDIEINYFKLRSKSYIFNEEIQFKENAIKDIGGTLIVNFIEKIMFKYG